MEMYYTHPSLMELTIHCRALAVYAVTGNLS